MDVRLIEDFGALGLGKDEVEQEEETNPWVDGDPARYDVSEDW